MSYIGYYIEAVVNLFCLLSAGVMLIRGFNGSHTALLIAYLSVILGVAVPLSVYIGKSRK